jgi:RimJ/RimL family protein N-acetyltransferase
MQMPTPRLTVAELEKGDLPFLLELWHIPEVMKYADELPDFRGWSKSDDIESAWARHQEMRAATGPGYAQLILRLADGTAIGESFFTPLPRGFTLDEWTMPEDLVCLMGDIKLRPEYWRQGLGAEGMKKVIAWLFANTDCDLLVVPPHYDNPAAVRVYEKAGFIHTASEEVWQGHRIMELSRSRFEAHSRPTPA